MQKTPVRPAFLTAAFATAFVITWILVFVISKKSFWTELNLVLDLVAAGWFVTLWSFLFFGWGLRGPELNDAGWTPKLQDPGWIAELLSHWPGGSLDFGGDDLLGILLTALVGLLATALFVGALVVVWGLVELVIFLVAALLFVLVNKGFRAQVVRNRRAKGRPWRSLWLSAYLTAVSVGWLPLGVFTFRWLAAGWLAL